MSDQQLQRLKACCKVRDITESRHPLVFEDFAADNRCQIGPENVQQTSEGLNSSCKTVQVEVRAAESRHEGCGHVRLQCPCERTAGSEGRGPVETQEPKAVRLQMTFSSSGATWLNEPTLTDVAQSPNSWHDDTLESVL